MSSHHHPLLYFILRLIRAVVQFAIRAREYERLATRRSRTRKKVSAGHCPTWIRSPWLWTGKSSRLQLTSSYYTLANEVVRWPRSLMDGSLIYITTMSELYFYLSKSNYFIFFILFFFFFRHR